MEVSLRNALSAAVDGMLPRFSPPDRGVSASVGCYITHAASGKELARTTFFFIFQRSNNFTKVMYTATAFGISQKWTMSSNHDVAWRHDGISLPISEWVLGCTEGMVDPYSVDSHIHSIGYVSVELDKRKLDNKSRYEYFPVRITPIKVFDF